MSKHSKSNDEPTGGRIGRANAAAGAAAQKADSVAANAARGAAPKEEDVWTEVANFVVTFERRDSAAGVDRRITAHKMQDDGITAKWTGVAQQPMCAWIANHTGDWGFTESVSPALTGLAGDSKASAAASMGPVSAAPGTVTSQVRALHAVRPDAPIEANHAACEPARPADAAARAEVPAPIPDASRVSLSIRTVTARQAGDSGPSAGAPTPATRVRLRGDEVFNLDATIEVAGATESLVTPLATQCRVQFFGRNMSTKKGIRLGEANVGVAESGGGAYRASLGGVTLPAGTYRLDSIATLPAWSAKLARAEGPMLDVT
jgi:hypothetical protein